MTFKVAVGSFRPPNPQEKSISRKLNSYDDEEKCGTKFFMGRLI